MMRRTFFTIVFATVLLYRISIPISKAIELQDGFWDPLCPRCGNAIDREFSRYCTCCGQRLNWFFWDKGIIEVTSYQKVTSDVTALKEPRFIIYILKMLF